MKALFIGANQPLDENLQPGIGRVAGNGIQRSSPSFFPGNITPGGVAWMGLDRPGYGVHGTPNAQQVGRTESHGYFRLANWDAEYLSQIVSVGMPVEAVE